MEPSSSSASSSVRVVVRIRPLLSSTTEVPAVAAIDENTAMIRSTGEKYKFKFHHVLSPSASQEDVYEHTAADLVQDHLLQGSNVTVMACEFFLMFASWSRLPYIIL